LIFMKKFTYSKIRDHIFEDMIIEYIGKNIFIYFKDSEFQRG